MGTKNNYWLAVIAVALGYFVDLYDLLLFSTVRKASLISLNIEQEKLTDIGLSLQNWQLFGMLVGGILIGVYADKKGRLSLLFVSIFIYSIANLFNAYVTSVPMYKCLRFIAGLGLAGELGVGITLATEIVPKHLRTIATMIISAFGLLGGVAAALVATKTTWQNAYIVGGVIGLLLLIFRFSLRESLIFQNLIKTDIIRGSLSELFLKSNTFKRFVLCIFSGSPGLFFTAFYVTLAPEFGEVLGIRGVKTADVLFYYMISLAFFDIVANLLSKLIKSRKKTILIFCIIQIIAVVNLLYNKPQSINDFIISYIILGASLGYWGVVITNIAENFGSEIRATATTSATNFIRALTIPGVWLYTFLAENLNKTSAGLIVGLIFISFSIISTLMLKDNFEKSLDFNE